MIRSVVSQSQIDITVDSRSKRIVGYADGAELRRLIEAGHLRGRWFPRKNGYAVIRPPRKLGRPEKITDVQVREVAAINEQIRALKKRRKEIILAAGVTYDAVEKRLQYWQRGARRAAPR